MKRSVQIAARGNRTLWSLALVLLVSWALSGALGSAAWAQAPSSGASPASGGAAKSAKAGGRKGAAAKKAGQPQSGQDANAAASSEDQSDDGMEDAGDEEMLTGQPAQPEPQRPPSEAEKGPLADISTTTRLSRTAVWVGDPFQYQIIVDHSPGIQFVLQNLNKDTLIMDPLKVESVTYKSTPLTNGQVRLLVDIGLRSYTVGAAEQAIPQVTLFYFRKEAGATTSEGTAAQSITVPGPTIGLRSTLPTEASDLRDAVTLDGWASSRWVIVGVGWAALVLLVAGFGWEGAMMVRYRKGRKGPDPRKAMAAIHDRWSQGVPMDFTDPERVLDFYGRSYKDLKEYLGYLLEAPTAGLTAEDVQGEMARLAASPDVSEKAARVLAACESARYARDGTGVVDTEQARNVAQDMREIFQIGARS